jgi:hypothetical protein
MKYNKESLKAEKSRLNSLMDQENRGCAKCKDKDSLGCEDCFHTRRKRKLSHLKEKVTEALANVQA